ncbi:MAG: Ig-like domain-containing protein [Chloroflexota bacterium]
MDEEKTEEQQPTIDKQSSEQGQTPEQGQPTGKDRSEQTPGSRKKAGGIVAVVLTVVAVGILAVNGGWFTQLLQGYMGEDGDGDGLGAAPEVIAITASTDRILPGDTVSVSCEAVDPDDEALTYVWSETAGEIVGNSSTVEWTAPDSEGLYQVMVTVSDEAGNTDDGSLALRVRDNTAPEILVMESEVSEETGWVVPGTSVYIECETEDADGDELTYAWSATAGDLYGEGESILWVAPEEPDTYWVTLVVEDTYGATAERSIPLTVNVAEPPVIHGFKLEALKKTSMFQPYGDSWRIFKERSCAIHAQVDDEENEYTYEWKAEAGNLTSEGPDAVWQAPASKGWVNIVLKVSDRHGNESTDSVHIHVETCPSCM